MNSGFDFPKIELHLHLDGAIAPSTLFRLANERKIELPAESAEHWVPYVVNDASCRSVNEYLTKFDLPTRVLQDSAALDTVAYELVLRLAAQGCGYAEIRFAPQLHTQKLLCQSDAIAAVVSGVRRALAGSAGIKIGVILCCMALGG
ncbi:MAG: adenosine deaminase, partial [Oscillospiraceae bacterium]